MAGMDWKSVTVVRGALACVSALLLTFPSLARDFTLTNEETGKKIGPFDYRDGEVVVLNGTRYTLRKIDKVARHVSKLKSIVIPVIDFENASIQTVVEFLGRRSEALDPEGLGVNFVLHLPTPNRKTEQTARAPTNSNGFPEFEEENSGFGQPAAATASHSARRITLKLERIPLYHAIHYVCLAAGLQYEIRENAVYIHSEEQPEK